MKKIALLCLVLILPLLSSAQIELKLTQLDSLTYGVYYKSSLDLAFPLNTTNNGLVTVKAPTGTLEVDSVISQVGGWTMPLSISSPEEAPEFDYFLFSLQTGSTDFVYQKGKEVLIFTFKSKKPIFGTLHLMEKEDPFSPPNSRSVNLGQLFTIMGAGPINAVTGIYQDTGYPQLTIKAFLQGPYNRLTNSMLSDLQKENLLPLLEPYSAINSPRFPVVDSSYYTLSALEESAESIIDWVFIELRSSIDSVVTSRPALLLSNGSIVGAADNASTSLEFDVEEGFYYVCLKHRNHLGIMTATPMYLGSNESTSIDFTHPSTATYGIHAQKNINGIHCLWAGDVNQDGKIIATGRANDMDPVIFAIVLDENNTDRNLAFSPKGYSSTDTNLNGRTNLFGVDSDIEHTVIQNITAFPTNPKNSINFIIQEQIPPLK